LGIDEMIRLVCIYCGAPDPTDRDHVPPRCLFPTRPKEAITVPSCRGCNESHGRDDERVRNLLTSLASTECHPAIQGELSGRRDRALNRDLTKLEHLLDSIMPVEVRTADGLHLGGGLAVDLDQPVLDRFLSRLTRGLLWHEIKVLARDCEIEWRMAPSLSDLDGMPPERRALLLSPSRTGSVGGDVFHYTGYLRPGRASSLWLFGFYEGVEFMTRCRAVAQQAARTIT
jgi:hypothetical protein